MKHLKEINDAGSCHKRQVAWFMLIVHSHTNPGPTFSTSIFIVYFYRLVSSWLTVKCSILVCEMAADGT